MDKETSRAIAEKQQGVVVKLQNISRDYFMP